MSGGDDSLEEAAALDAEAERAYAEACEILQEEASFDGRRLGAPDGKAKKRILRAIELAKRVLEIRPDSYGSWLVIGKMYERMGDRKQALAAFQSLLAIEPNAPGVAKDASVQAAALGQYDVARALMEEAVRARPEDPAALANLAVLLLIAQRPEDALRALEESFRLEGHAMTESLRSFTREVLAGKRKCPKDVFELQREMGRKP